MIKPNFLVSKKSRVRNFLSGSWLPQLPAGSCHQ